MSAGSAPPPGPGGPPPPGPFTPALDSPPDEHFPELAAYVLGAMEPDQRVAFERHLNACALCRAEEPGLIAALGPLEGAPPELLLDGPPEDADLLIRRTVRRIRSEEPVRASSRAPGLTPGRALALVAAAALVAATVGGVVGGVVGRRTAPAPVAGPAPSVTASVVPGTLEGTSTDPTTGARLSVTVVPAMGWVRVTATAAGIRQGEPCHLIVVSKQNRRVEVGSWRVGERGARLGTVLQASALVEPGDVKAVRVENSAGDILVSTPV